MPKFTQDNRPLQLITPLGKDVLLAVGLNGEEVISDLYEFSIDCLADVQDVVANKIKFDQMMGEPISVALQLPNNKKRFFSGICQCIEQSDSGIEFTRFQLTMVPTIWLLTKRWQSRIFQHKNIPDILKEVLKGLKVDFRLQGTFEPRDYCVQYRESDYNFACRLMEEEGIYFYFKHEDSGETIIVGNTPAAHKPLEPTSKIKFKNPQQNRAHNEEFIESFIKSQEIISGNFTLRDHCFELPHKSLEAERKTDMSVALGKVTTSVAPNKVSSKLENYDWPGAYAQRFDGINAGGGEQPGELQKIFSDNKRTVNIRADQERVQAVSVEGLSDCRHLASGFRFTLESVASDISVVPSQADGDYVLTQVSHTIEAELNFRSGPGQGFLYKNSFTCIPFAIPFRPQQEAYIPVVYGSQTAVVVGPVGEEIFTDKYGRVKVQFHWDRQGQNNADSSCWIRVGTLWAGRGWGMLQIPRIGQEVIVDFLEGDPDQPIIVGSINNADQMPHYKLPDERTKSYLKTNTSPGGDGFNEIRIEDKKGKEQIFIHSERNMDIRVKNDRMDTTVANQHLTVGTTKDGKNNGSLFEQISNERHIKVEKDQEEAIEGGYSLAVGKEGGDNGSMNVQIEKDNLWLVRKENHLKVLESQFVVIDKNSDLTVKNDYKIQVDQDLHTTVKELSFEKIGKSKNINAGVNVNVDAGKDMYLGCSGEMHIKAGTKIVLEAGTQVSLKVGGNFVDINAAGVAINGTVVLINSGGAAGTSSLGKGVDAQPPTIAKTASKAKPKLPTLADDSKTGKKSN